MTHRFEMLAFLTEKELGLLLQTKDRLAKFNVLSSHWTSCALVRALFKDCKREVKDDDDDE